MNQQSNRTMARPRSRKPGLDNTTKILLVAFAVVGILLAFIGGKFVFNLVKSWTVTDLPGAPVDTQPGITGTEVVPEAPLQSNDGPAAAAWDGKSRINILLLGLDYSARRQAQDQGSPLSDTMILVTIDPLSRTIGALSIRRDLWVSIPGFDYNKINSAYKLGEDYKLPGGGPGLAMETVEAFLGVPIDFYARVEFSTFVKLIDEIGGIKINIAQDMLLDWEGKGNKFTVPAGEYVLPGSYALAYARTRDAEYGEGDIARGSRQMEVVMAVRDRVMNVDTMSKLVSRAPAIYKDVSEGVKTNMSLNQAIQLAMLMTQIPRENMHTYNIDYSMTTPETSPDGLYIMRPIPEQIRILRDQMFAAGSVAAAPIELNTGGDTLSLAKAENARIEVLNGTASAGLAETTGTYLTSQGLTVVSTGNAGENYPYTMIFVHNPKPYTLGYLTGMMQVPNSRIMNQFNTNSPSDITIYVGNEWANANPMP